MQTRAAVAIRTKVRCRVLGLGAALAVLVALAVLMAPAAGAQTGRTVVALDTSWVTPGAASEVVDALAADGWLLARVDSARADTVFVTRGPRARVASVELVGASLDAVDVGSWSTQVGGLFQLDSLRHDLARAAQRYAAIGHRSASLVPDLRVAQGGAEVDVVVRVDEGAASPVVAVELVGARRASRAFASRRAGLTGPTAPADVDRLQIQRALEASGLYTEVGVPTLALDGADLILQVPVVEAPPGAFDVVLGYLPPAGGAPGGVVGRGRVDVRNLFGGGRTASAQLERTPGLASSVAVDVSDPSVLGSAFGVGASFAGDARDSTLSRQRVGADVRYLLARDLEVSVSLARESVRPGTFGARQVGGVPRVRRDDQWLVGAGLRFRRLDAVRNPRRGALLVAVVEQGRASRAETRAASRRRLTVQARAFVPTLARQTLVVGADAVVSQRDLAVGTRTDEGDLVRFGGAASFRGYDEASLLAASYGRALAEYRFLFDASSFAFGFLDLGLLDRPALADAQAERRRLVGYGAGLRVSTGIGLATVTYALNPDLSAGRGKIHVGLAVGL